MRGPSLPAQLPPPLQHVRRGLLPRLAQEHLDRPGRGVRRPVLGGGDDERRRSRPDPHVRLPGPLGASGGPGRPPRRQRVVPRRPTPDGGASRPLHRLRAGVHVRRLQQGRSRDSALN